MEHCIRNWDLPESEKLRYSQIFHFVKLFRRDKPSPPVFTRFERWCYQMEECKGGISIIYASLSEASSKFLYMEAWERDLQETWSLDEWHKVGTRAYKGLLNVSLIESNLKVLMRWYLVPSRLASMFPTASPLCFRDCQAQGTMLHIWWDCPKIRGFWNKIFNLIRKVTGVPVEKNPQVALLGTRIPQASKQMQKLITFMLLGAKTTLAGAWKQPRVSIMAAKKKISWVMTQEKLVSSILNTSQLFEAIWEPWAKYVGVSLLPGTTMTPTNS